MPQLRTGPDNSPPIPCRVVNRQNFLMTGTTKVDDPADLDLSAVEMQATGEAVLTRVVAHLAALHEVLSCGDFTDIEDLCRSMRESVPEQGAELQTLLDPLFDDWIPRSFTTPGPGYFAYIPGGGIFPAALADFIADTTNHYTGIWQAAPALVQLEAKGSTGCVTGCSFPPRRAGYSPPVAPWRCSTRLPPRARNCSRDDIVAARFTCCRRDLHYKRKKELPKRSFFLVRSTIQKWSSQRLTLVEHACREAEFCLRHQHLVDDVNHAVALHHVGYRHVGDVALAVGDRDLAAISLGGQPLALHGLQHCRSTAGLDL